jgi:hypothetical protein
VEAINKSVKTPVVVRNSYVMYLEFWDNQLWFHTDVLDWTSKIKQEFIEDLKTLQSLLPLPLIALVTEDNSKLAKFGEKVGWTKKETIMLNNGSKAYIYSWSK